MTINTIYDYMGAGFRVFQLHGVSGGACGCGDPACKAAGKHPQISSWQNTPHWSEEQIDNLIEYDIISTGFGVCVDDHLIIDIDPRNGGDESYLKMTNDSGLDFEALSGFVVRTGGGGRHIYFDRPPGAYMAHLDDYPGIDFKTSGYVVGCGSLHVSGLEYEAQKGDLDKLTPAPPGLLSRLEKRSTYRGESSGSTIDITEQQIADMLSHIDPDCDYETWVRVGMAIHDTTNGAGFELFDAWSSAGEKYTDPNDMDKKWHSFGKSGNPVTLGTLIHYAEEGGYKFPVTFEISADPAPPASASDHGDHPFAVDSVDLTAPPGLVGELAEWINSNSRFPRRYLSTAAALTCIGNIAGLRYTDDLDGVTTNLFSLCVAGSGTGKESIQQSVTEIMRVAGLAPAIHGGIKSEQEIIRNLIRHQAAYYVIDELGYLLKKIDNAQKKGTAGYLEGVIALLMSAYSKADGYQLVSGDVKDEVRKQIRAEITQIKKMIDANEMAQAKGDSKISQMMTAIRSIDTGIDRPFVSLLGFTTPVSFDGLITYEQATNGFIGRSLIIRESETNPKRNKKYKRQAISDRLRLAIHAMRATGTYEDGERIEHYGDRSAIPTTDEAAGMLAQAEEWFHTYAESHKSKTGMEAIPRRSYELVSKLSLILAIPGGLREAQHVRWAYMMARRDVDTKVGLAHSNALEESRNGEDLGEVLRNKIIDVIGHDDGQTEGVILQRCGRGKYTKQDITKMLETMCNGGVLSRLESVHPANKVKFFRFSLNSKTE